MKRNENSWNEFEQNMFIQLHVFCFNLATCYMCQAFAVFLYVQCECDWNGWYWTGISLQMDNSSCWHFTISKIYTFYDDFFFFFFIPFSQSQVAKRNGRFMFSAFHICMHGYHIDKVKNICQLIHCQLYQALKHLPIAHAFRLDTNLILFPFFILFLIDLNSLCQLSAHVSLVTIFQTFPKIFNHFKKF